MTTRILSNKPVSNSKLVLAAATAGVAILLGFGACTFDDQPQPAQVSANGDYSVADVDEIPAAPTRPVSDSRDRWECAVPDRPLPFTPYRPVIQGQTNVAKAARPAWQLLDARMTGIIRWFANVDAPGPYGQWDELKQCVFGCDPNDPAIQQAAVDARTYAAECRTKTITEADVIAILGMGNDVSVADRDGFLVKWLNEQAIE